MAKAFVKLRDRVFQKQKNIVFDVRVGVFVDGQTAGRVLREKHADAFLRFRFAQNVFDLRSYFDHLLALFRLDLKSFHDFGNAVFFSETALFFGNRLFFSEIAETAASTPEVDTSIVEVSTSTLEVVTSMMETVASIAETATSIAETAASMMEAATSTAEINASNEKAKAVFKTKSVRCFKF